MTLDQAGCGTEPLSRRVPKILVVDDDPQISEAIQRRLVNYNVEVIRRFTGLQGTGEAVSERPDLIITDLNMPHGEGDYLLSSVRQNDETAEIPVIVLTGRPGDETAKQVMNMGATAFFRKPVRFADLVDEISKHLELLDVDWESHDTNMTPNSSLDSNDAAQQPSQPVEHCHSGSTEVSHAPNWRAKGPSK